ncbi:MAG: hypothetical protein Q7J60_05930, partial [Bradyrhizobium sp.]|nr:hypothetical protein [Bradyrhizobium sp.]
MRVFVLATILLATSSLSSFAQEQGKTPAAAPQAGAPAQTDQAPPASPDQKADRAQQKPDNRAMGPDWRIRRSDNDRMDRDDREKGHGGMMRRSDSDRMDRDDRETRHGGMIRRSDSDRMDRDSDIDRGRLSEGGDRDWDRADRDRFYQSYAAERPR